QEDLCLEPADSPATGSSVYCRAAAATAASARGVVPYQPRAMDVHRALLRADGVGAVRARRRAAPRVEPRHRLHADRRGRAPDGALRASRAAGVQRGDRRCRPPAEALRAVAARLVDRAVLRLLARRMAGAASAAAWLRGRT